MKPFPLRRVSALAASALFVALAGCRGDGEAASKTVSDPAPIVGDILVSDDAFGQGDHLAVTDNFLWLTDASGDPFLHLVNRQSRMVMRSFGRRGEGPGEYQSARWVVPDKTGTDQVFVYDPSSRRITTLHADSTGQVTVIGVKQMTELSPHPRQLGTLGDGFVGWLSDSVFRWVFLDSLLQPTGTIGGALVGPKNVDWRQRINASSSLGICEKPDGTRFAVVYTSAGRIEIHQPDVDSMRLAEVPRPTDGNFVTFPNYGDDLRWKRSHYHYSGCASTDSFLFALYSGRPVGKPVDVAWAGSTVHVFDWEGRLTRIIPLSNDVTRIASDKSGTTLFGTGSNGNTIFSFEIPMELR